jgi:hypothetical protein
VIRPEVRAEAQWTQRKPEYFLTRINADSGGITRIDVKNGSGSIQSLVSIREDPRESASKFQATVIAPMRELPGD